VSESDDSFRDFDAVYVLGALSPEERARFEQHLTTCAACTRSVSELAGMPGLLAQVDPAPGLSDDDAPPPGLRAGTVRAVRTVRRRRLITTVAAAVVAVVASAAFLGSVLAGGEDDVGGTAMTPLGAFPVEAAAHLEEASWGTRVEMSCSYGGREAGDYLLVAVKRDGTEDQLASWRAIPADEARLSVGTALKRGDIESLEVRLTNGKAVLRLTP